jgi:hypothetical protein
MLWSTRLAVTEINQDARGETQASLRVSVPLW